MTEKPINLVSYWDSSNPICVSRNSGGWGREHPLRASCSLLNYSLETIRRSYHFPLLLTKNCAEFDDLNSEDTSFPRAPVFKIEHIKHYRHYLEGYLCRQNNTKKTPSHRLLTCLWNCEEVIFGGVLCKYTWKRKCGELCGNYLIYTWDLPEAATILSRVMCMWQPPTSRQGIRAGRNLLPILEPWQVALLNTVKVRPFTFPKSESEKPFPL